MDLIKANFKKIIRDKHEHLNYAFKQCSINGEILEFGVFKGNSINYLASLTKQIIHGFDSFEGLPEPWKWGPHKILPPERFSVDKIPEVKSNVQLYKGWFNETIPDWKYYNTNSIKFIHIDSDLYSSCKTILKELNKQIIPGTIIVFDEIFNYDFWMQGEWKALMEWLKEYNREVTPIARTHRFSASIKVVK